MTDKEEKSQKWNLPAVEMAPGDYILIVASGKIKLLSKCHIPLKNLTTVCFHTTP